jgi:hypothetical protein
LHRVGTQRPRRSLGRGEVVGLASGEKGFSGAWVYQVAGGREFVVGQGNSSKARKGLENLQNRRRRGTEKFNALSSEIRDVPGNGNTSTRLHMASWRP